MFRFPAVRLRPRSVSSLQLSPAGSLGGMMLVLLSWGITWRGAAQATGTEVNLLQRGQSVVLVNPSQPSGWTNSLRSLRTLGGWRLDLMPVSPPMVDLPREIALLYLPGAIATNLSPSSAQDVLERVRQGMALITEGRSEVATGLGLQFAEGTDPVGSLRNAAHPGEAIQWSEAARVPRLTSGYLRVFDAEVATGAPVVVGGALGDGRFLFLGASLDEPEGWGYGRFPFLHEAITDHLEGAAWLRRDELCVYLDWGFHYFEDPVALASRLKQSGVREVQVSGWYTPAQNEGFLRAFIQACHARAMRVHCWLELPHVGAEFWQNHPEWREITASGHEAQVAWRSLMALEVPECFDAVKALLADRFARLDWDGVNLAELYFEAPGGGFYDRERFTPMHPWVRADVRRVTGIDPVELFDPASPHSQANDPAFRRFFVDYRIATITDLNRRLLEFLAGLRPAEPAPLDLTLTQIDGLLDPAMPERIGVDLRSMVGALAGLPVTLQVEDPFTLWEESPARYETMAAAYRPLLPQGTRLAFDINIVDRGAAARPLRKQTGLEFLSLVSTAARAADEVCVYAANTVEASDLRLAPYALGSVARSERVAPGSYRTSSRVAFRLQPGRPVGEVWVDGQPWPGFTGTDVLVPGGGHRVVVRTNASPCRLRLVDFTGDTLSWTQLPRGIQVRYGESRRNYVGLSLHPARIQVDGVFRDLPVQANPDTGGATVTLPSGQHEVVFEDDTPCALRGLGLRSLGVTGSVFRYAVSGPPGRTVVLQSSADLAEWGDLRADPLPEGELVLEVEAAGGWRYFRVVLGP